MAGCGRLHPVFCEPAPTSEREIPALLFWENESFGTQVLGVRSPAEQGTGDIQQVCRMQTRFRSPHLPPGKRQMPLFSGRPHTKNLQPSLYVFPEQ